jgi:hypothetical protein
MQIRSLALGAVVLSLGSLGTSARAEDAPAPVIVRGTIARVDATSIAITRADGTTVTAAIVPTTSLSTVEPRRFEQIKSTDFVGITSVPGPNGTLEAEEIHVIPFRGLNEGSYPWDHHPEGAKPAAAGNKTNGTVAVVHNDSHAPTTMTNANVTAASGMQLQVSYQGSTMVGGKCVGHAPRDGDPPCKGVATVDVPPWTPIAAIVPAMPGEIKAGLAVFATTTAGPQGKPVAMAVVAEKNGLKPQF